MTTTDLRPAPVRVLRRLLIDDGLLVVLILLWQLVTAIIDSPFFPTPLEIAVNFVKLFIVDPQGHVLATAAMTHDALPMMGRAFAGFLAGSAVGVLLGIWTGLSRLFAETTSWTVEFLRAIPSTATLPLFILLLGGSDAMRIAFIAYGVSWYVLINTAQGVRAIDPTLLLVGRAYRKSRATQVLTIVIPAALPQIFTSLRLATAGAIILGIASEFLVSSNGIGYRLLIAQANFQMLDLWSWIVFLALLGLVVNVVVGLIERKVLSWHRMSH